ncbi:phosphatase PAP2 family protein [Herminiimonas fonticola]|uniref:PAP2 superfamily protein n=1 Tax=Herminiimonas fonticola TaxID=303380 RepID=A0A4R6G765_9BURK|nr:phosphatase PAP2 family protein [Herminiimonas fonticola]RBA22993.1 PAP2 superfamily [Herminiimonas fonticola]TDN89565.1 PAP2 superfamily protein [Herminiimonas fonticola]
MIFWAAFTKLADSNFTMPLAALLSFWLAGARAWKPFFQWSFLFGSGIVLVVATKIAYIGWGAGIAALDFTGISGHAMRATAIAPALMAILLQKQTRQLQQIGLLAGLVFGIAIGISRLAIHVHSISEVISGCILGAIVSLSFAWLIRNRPIVFDRKLLIIGVIALLPVLTLKPAPTESWMESVAYYLSGKERPAQTTNLESVTTEYR